jgi:hypothetical protein
MGRILMYACPQHGSEAQRIRLSPSPERGKAPARRGGKRWPSSDGADSGSHKRILTAWIFELSPSLVALVIRCSKSVRTLSRCPRIIRATFTTGLNRKCVAQKDQCLQCRKAQPLRR